MTDAAVPSTSFGDIPLKPELLHAIEDCGFQRPYKVQLECIPQAILGMDIVCTVRAGSGKTVAFVLATLQRLEPIDGEVSVLVICDHRELALRISKDYERFGKYLSSIKVSTFIGGTPIRKDQDILGNNCPHIVIGTPSRILALANSGNLKLDKIKCIVIDECSDLLGDPDLRGNVETIVQKTPLEKQVMMFNPFVSEELRNHYKTFVREEKLVWINIDFGSGCNNFDARIDEHTDMEDKKQ